MTFLCFLACIKGLKGDVWSPNMDENGTLSNCAWCWSLVWNQPRHTCNPAELPRTATCHSCEAHQTASGGALGINKRGRKTHWHHCTTCMNLPIAVFFLTVLPALQLLFGKLKCFGILPIGILPIQPTIAYVHVLPLGVGFSHLPAPMPTSPHAPGTLQTTTSACGSGGKRWKTGHSPKQNVQNAWQTLTQNKYVGSGEAYQY